MTTEPRKRVVVPSVEGRPDVLAGVDALARHDFEESVARFKSMYEEAVVTTEPQLWVVEFDEERFGQQGYHAFSWGDMRQASPADILAVVRTLDGVEERQWHGPIVVMPKGRPDLGSELPPGRYLVVPIPREETK